ncbi:MAG: hypothetical protein N2035_09555, partial [Chthoniobacterales bacterium]|nr:hypothetical protein [Chthoniobacterales bacterium]
MCIRDRCGLTLLLEVIVGSPFYSLPFCSPLSNSFRKRGTIVKKIVRIVLLFFKREEMRLSPEKDKEIKCI